MNADFKRNYQNKIKIVTRQIELLEQKINSLSKQEKKRLDSLLLLRENLKECLSNGKPLSVHITYLHTQVSFFQIGKAKNEHAAEEKSVKSKRPKV